MDPRRDPQRPISTRKQLLVEGRTAELFFEVLAAHLSVQELEIRQFSSISDLTPFLRAFCSRPEFKQQVESLAIVRDAEFTVRAGRTPTEPQTARQAFQSVCSSLAAAGLPGPSAPGVFTLNTPIYDPLVGRAAQQGIWPWESPVFGPLKEFLLTL